MSTIKGVNRTKADNPIADNIIDPSLQGGKSIDYFDYRVIAVEQAIDTVIEMSDLLPIGAIIEDVKLEHTALGAGVTLAVGDAVDPDRYISAIDASSAGFTNNINVPATIDGDDVVLKGRGYRIGSVALDNQILITSAVAVLPVGAKIDLLVKLSTFR